MLFQAVESLKDIATSESSDYSEPYTNLSCVPLRSKPSLNIPSVVFEVRKNCLFMIQ